MLDARVAGRVLLGLICLQACTRADDTGSPATGQSGQPASGAPAGAGVGAGGSGGGAAGGSGGGAGTMTSASGAGGSGGMVVAAGSGGSDGGGDAGGADDAGPASCAPRAIAGTPEVHFHHVHFNTADPEADLMFFERFFAVPPVTFCSDDEGRPLTRATRTERGWFLYTKVDEPPDSALNTYLEHVGWVTTMPVEDLARMVDLGVTLYPEGRAQCANAAMGIAPCPVTFLAEHYYYYVQAPSGARVEVALGPGPATGGFGHVHFIMGEDLTFFATVSDGAYADTAIDEVNHIDASLMESILDSEMVVETRGKPIDHIAYSTTDLEAAKMRIETAGIAIAEDISWKPEYGFRSFFVRTAKGTWLEMVEDSRFQ